MLRLHEDRVLQAGQKFTVDTGHIVRLMDRWGLMCGASAGKSTILSGEGCVELTGPGRVLMNPFGRRSWAGCQIPQKSIGRAAPGGH
jgi:uncharacterized protein (AIM24 family)